MKIPKFLLQILLICTLSIGLTSCDADDWDEDVLTGKWWSVDNPYDVICLDFYSNHKGICTEQNYSYYTSDPFTWFVDDHLIHVVFTDGSSWIWDYDLYDGRTVRINNRLFSRSRYYSNAYKRDTALEKKQ